MKLLLEFFGAVTLLLGPSLTEVNAETSHQELWVMIKLDDYFRSNAELQIIDEVTILVEAKKLGYLDGHSSGAGQLDFNFYDVRDFIKAQKIISKFLTNKYPDLEFSIDEEYQTIYESP